MDDKLLMPQEVEFLGLAYICRHIVSACFSVGKLLVFAVVCHCLIVLQFIRYICGVEVLL
jgi:hypothetical protein